MPPDVPVPKRVTCATAVVDVTSIPTDKGKNWVCGKPPKVTPGLSSKRTVPFCKKSRCRKLVEAGEPKGLVSNSTDASPLPDAMNNAPRKP